MSDPKNANVLTRERLEDLRLIATGATRRADGSIYEPDRNRLHWLRDHGFLELHKVPAGSSQQQRRESRVVTAKGREALGRCAYSESRKVAQRGVDFPCEDCGKKAGSTRDARGYYRCSFCGYPGQ